MTRIYISSTFEDLEEYRACVYRLLCKVTGREIRAMEDYVACDERPLDRCRSDIDECDVYVGVFAWRYGFVPAQDNPQQLSITECEYRRARDQGKECLIFLLDEKVPWSPLRMDSQAAGGDHGAQIARLRAELGSAHTVSRFSSPDQLAGLVSAAVTNWEQASADRDDAEQDLPAAAPPQFRELLNSVLIAYAGDDEALARMLAAACAPSSAKPVLISPTALFADDADELAALEGDVTRCATALVVITPAALARLRDDPARTRRVLDLMRARLGGGCVRAVLAGGVARDALAPDWPLEPVLELAAATLDVGHRNTLGEWLADALPAWGVTVVGLPVCVVAMREEEARALVADPGIVGAELGTRIQGGYEAAANELAQGGVDWPARYAAARMGWQPFGPEHGAVSGIVESVVENINRRELPKLRKKHIKVQWYPFDGVMQPGDGGDPGLRTVYQDVARAGCVLLVDEMSLFHPVVRGSLVNSPLFNNDRVALVTVSPVDPSGVPLNQRLEDEARRKLASAFTRFALDYDPQCELAVGSARHLKRWLHVSLPETVIHLREPRPDAQAMNDFFDDGGVPERQSQGGYPWGGGEPS